ncbi:MAG TPA: hypothetical protein VFA58_03200 [Chthoniobacterales bacterium]|nr:hypothetical protein [Chthoniobacterales bacterium]
MTLMEVLAAFLIIGIIAILLIPAVSGFKSRAQRVQCMANLRSLYTATELFVQQNGSWPQIDSDDSDENDQASATAWIAALKPFGTTEKTWICPTIQNLMLNPDYTKPENVRIDYIATPFDDKPATPHQWPRQPWFIETGDVHGHGNLIIFTDGSISDLRTVTGK